MVNFLTENWIQILTTLGLAIGWLVDRRNRKLATEEVQGNVFDQMQKSYESYIEHHQQQQALIRDENSKLAARLSDIENTLQEERREREEDLKQSKKERDKLLERIKDFERKTEGYELTISSLKNEINVQREQIAQQQKELEAYRLKLASFKQDS